MQPWSDSRESSGSNIHDVERLWRFTCQPTTHLLLCGLLPCRSPTVPRVGNPCYRNPRGGFSGRLSFTCTFLQTGKQTLSLLSWAQLSQNNANSAQSHPPLFLCPGLFRKESEKTRVRSPGCGAGMPLFISSWLKSYSPNHQLPITFLLQAHPIWVVFFDLEQPPSYDSVSKAPCACCYHRACHVVISISHISLTGQHI